MATSFVCSSPDQAVLVRALAGDIVLGKTLYSHIASLHIGAWVPVNLMLGVTP